uniref:GDP-fucose pyrophosphorylase domain-containing protein n=1 Tax=Geospiza parvula TaxID=87175 RepID=A0A8U8AQP8_GEOPR
SGPGMGERSAARREDTARRLARFAALRGAGAAARPGELWDVVVLTAADAAQAGAFREQLAEKLRREQLPRAVRYLVCADPPGPRIGNGGSTLHALRCLEEQYGDQWTSFTVLLIHSGGNSQRLPSASALGKIFTALPLGEPVSCTRSCKAPIIQSILEPGCVIGPGSVIEYSRIGPEVSVGKGSIVSGSYINFSVNLPSGCFLSSVSVKMTDRVEYVTMVFGVGDNLKKGVKLMSDIHFLQFFGVSLPECLDLWSLEASDQLFSSEDTHLGLWTARIFPVCSTLSESVRMSLNMLNSVQHKSAFKLSGFQLLSVEEMLTYKDVEDMLKFRKQIYGEICLQKEKSDYRMNGT